MDVTVPMELIKERERKAAAEAKWRERLLETLTHFPFVPFGERVVLLQRQPEHVSKGGILLPQSAHAPLSGWVVAVPHDVETHGADEFSTEKRSSLAIAECHLAVCVGDQVLFPDHASHRIQILVGLGGEEQRQQEFLVIEARDLHGVIESGRVESMKEVVPGLEKGDYTEGADVNG